jgi:hypothetical protein
VTKVDLPIFHWLHMATAPRIHYWLDADRLLMTAAGGHRGKSPQAAAPGVVVLERNVVGVYDIAVLRAGSERDLLDWLRRNSYQITPKLAPALADYIRRGWVFTAMRINSEDQARSTERLHAGVLQSIQFEFCSAQPVYPLKISALNPGKTELLLYTVWDYRAAASSLRTECALDQPPYMAGLLDGMGYRREPSPPRLFFTKLAGSLTPEDMGDDLALRPAADQGALPPGQAPAPFLESLGAVFVLFLSFALTLPYSLGILAICLAVGRLRNTWWVVVAGVVVVFGSFVSWAMLQSAPALAQAVGYWPAGLLALALAGGVALCLALGLRARRRAAARKNA